MAKKKDYEFFGSAAVESLCDFLADDASHFVLQEVLQSVAIDYSKFAPTELTILKRLRAMTVRDLGAVKRPWMTEDEWRRSKSARKLTIRNVKYDIKNAGLKSTERASETIAQWVFKKRAGYALSRYIVGARLVQKLRGKSFRHTPKTAWDSNRTNMDFTAIRKNAHTFSKRTNDTRLKVREGDYIEFFTFCAWLDKAYAKGQAAIERRIEKHKAAGFRKWAKNLEKRKDYQDGFQKFKD